MAAKFDITENIGKRSVAQRIERHRKGFKKRNRREPTDHELQLEIFDEEHAHFIENWLVGLARNTWLRRARYFHKRKEYPEAVTCYLIVCLYDANGPRNAAAVDARNRAQWQIPDAKPFDPTVKWHTGILPGITHRIGISCRKGGLQSDDVRQLFVEHAAEWYDEYMPLKPGQVWPLIEAQLEI